jgi:hypothetical protein
VHGETGKIQGVDRELCLEPMRQQSLICVSHVDDGNAGVFGRTRFEMYKTEDWVDKGGDLGVRILRDQRGEFARTNISIQCMLSHSHEQLQLGTYYSWLQTLPPEPSA